MILERAVPILHGMLMDRAIGMHMNDDVAFVVLMSRVLMHGALMSGLLVDGVFVAGVSLCVAVVVMVGRADCALSDKGSLKGKGQRRRHHDDVNAPTKRRPPA